MEEREPRLTWRRQRIIAAIAVVSAFIAVTYVCTAPLRQSSQAVTQASAVSTAQRIAAAEVACRAQKGRYAAISELCDLGLLEADYVSDRAKGHYEFRVEKSSGDDRFLVHAIPIPGWASGSDVYFSVDEELVVRWRHAAEADSSAAALSTP